MTNLLKRSISGFLFLIVTIGALFCSYGYALLMLIVTIVASLEIFAMLVPGKRYRKEKICIVTASIALFVLSFCHFAFGLDSRFIVAGFLPVILAFILMLYDCCDDYDFNTSLFFPLIYITVPICTSLLLVFPEGNFSWKIMLGMFVMIWCSDVGAYCFGMLFGQKNKSRKLFPAVSPKKSWAGAFGGALCSFLAAWAVYGTFGSEAFGLVHWIVLSLFVVTIGVYGDLFESLIKRHAGVKDSGDIIPGHGGILDRYDDVLVLIFIFAVYLKLFALI